MTGRLFIHCFQTLKQITTIDVSEAVSFFKTLSPSRLILVRDESVKEVPIHGALLVCPQDQEICFASDDQFQFENEGLKYYFWKFFPRKNGKRPYVNPKVFVGQADAILTMFLYIYTDESYKELSFGDKLFRFFFEQQVSPVIPHLVLSLHDVLSIPTPYPRNIHDTLKKTVAMFLNRCETRSEKIFRYAPNQAPLMAKNISFFLSRLKCKEAFAFSHFNDGEITFIQKFLQNDHKEIWFGRKQNKYSPCLGAQLVAAFQRQVPGYYVGVPCGTCHPELRAIADRLLENHTRVVPAMTFHHNLSYYPQLFQLLRHRQCFFVKNKYQNLTFLEKLGIKITKENTIEVPYKDAASCFESLKEHRFPEEGVVLLFCGMLARVLIPIWFERHTNTTFITLGSSLDDFTQDQRWTFNLRPHLPLTGDLRGKKRFLFGPKKHCVACWNPQEAPVLRHIVFPDLAMLKKVPGLMVQWKRYFEVQRPSFSPKTSCAHMLNVPVVISVTTLPHQTTCLQATLHSLLDQSILPDCIEINIPIQSKDKQTTYDLSRFYWDNPLISVFPINDDLGPITKLIPTLKRYRHHPQALIICVDDDICYPRTLVEEFLEAHMQHPDAALTRTGSLCPSSFKDSDRKKLKAKGHWLTQCIPTDIVYGYTGFCVQPRFFEDDFCDPQTFVPETYFADDIWISGHLARRKIPRYAIPIRSARLEIPFKEARSDQRLCLSQNKDGKNNEVLMRYFANYW